jgi:hypothetical protein
MERMPETGEQLQGARDQFAFLKTVVADEDYATGRRQHAALMSGQMSHVLFGRNERGGQVFHQWVDRLLEADDAELAAILRASAPARTALAAE